MSETQEVTLGEEGTVPVIEKAPTPAEDKVQAHEAAKGPAAAGAKVPDGHTSRTLTQRDINLCDYALYQYTQKPAHGDQKGVRKAQKLRRLLDTEGANDYFEDIQDKNNEDLAAWVKQKNEYLNGRGEKPGAKPELTDAQLIGVTHTYHIVAKLDTFLESAIKDAAPWPKGLEKGVEELSLKFGLKEDD